MKEQQSKKAHSSGEAFFQCAAVFFPYLLPVELASISLTCITLYQIAKLVTARRISDSSRNFENVPIPFLNPIVGDSQPYPYFLYTPTQVLQMKPDLRQPWGSDNVSQMCQGGHTRPDPFLFRVEGGIGCGCVDKGGICDNCPCTECGPSCMCDFGCGNRMTQGGVSVKLKIVKDDRKGWGLYAAELIPEGKFVCEYTGELISTKESRQRQQKYDELASNGCFTPALLVVKEHFPSGNVCIRINIDATRIGNVARFINHSCDGGNLETVIVRSTGSLLSRVCFFALREIQENEEISFSYGCFRLKPNGQRCFCDTSSCTGFLPSEHT
ncbi:histone-lysine N-methyltransferase SUVR3 [Primulina huaijiensis]|uniref:histone-lysine N-methyltransferase SUVR3 n=1 Tax=Primulina huaijiensis TaxID=1492673 RepID=UPI003CC6FEDC